MTWVDIAMNTLLGLSTLAGFTALVFCVVWAYEEYPDVVAGIIVVIAVLIVSFLIGLAMTE